jgi:spermidine/putrescine-binding protein
VEEVILARMPDAPVNSYRMLFDPNIVSKFKSCGVTLLEEAVDVYPPIMAFLGIDPQSSDLNDLGSVHFCEKFRNMLAIALNQQRGALSWISITSLKKLLKRFSYI